jgi:outer membrane protein assembly factor BamB
MKYGRCLILLAVLGAVLLTGVRAGENPNRNWTTWRGPSGQGHVDDSRVPLTWSDKENVLWSTALPGKGNSTPIISGNRIFLTAAGNKGDERYVLCLDRNDGKILWKQLASKGVPPGRTHGWNGYASASCTTDGERVYAFFGTPGLFCYDIKGKLLWQHSFGTFTSATGWGTSASPFLFEDLVIQNCDNDGPKALSKGEKDAAPMALIALDKIKGTVRWQTPRNQGRGFSTPRLITTPKGRLELVLNGPNGVWSYDPKSGKEIWHILRSDGKDQAKFGEPMPVSVGEIMVATSGRPGPMQAFKLDGSGDITRSHLIWETRRKGRDVGSPIIWGDYLYAADSRQAALTCYDLKTGKEIYTKRLSSGGQVLSSPIVVQGKLLFLLDNGETVVLEPGPQYKVIHRNVLSGHGGLDFGASPVVVDGRLYLRSQSRLYCIGAKQ